MRLRTIHLGLATTVFVFATAMACGDPETLGGDGTFHDDAGGGGDGTSGNDGQDGGRGDTGPGGDFGSLDASGHKMPTSDSSCAATTSATKLDPLNMIILFDRSKSMQDDAKWTTVTHALSGFLQSASSDALGISLGYFPLDYICSRAQYTTPSAPLTVLPAGRAALVSNIQSQNPFVETYGGTPMLPALEGALTYAKGLAASDALRRNVVVMATDGYPEGCLATEDGGAPNTIADVVSFVKGAAETVPKVKTFVIGVGSQLTSLNGIAAAGQTGSAFLVDTVGTSTEESFRQALDSVRRQAAACDFAIPASKEAIDFNNVNVVYKESPSASEQFMGYVPTAADCATIPAGTKAWYYDDPKSPKRLNLCPSTCSAVQSEAVKDGVVSVQFGCTRIEVPR